VTTTEQAVTRRWRYPTTRKGHLLVALIGLVILTACGLVARNGTVGTAERRVFRAVNDLPQSLYRVMWTFQQFGNLVVAFVVVIVVALVLRRPKVAIGAVAAVVLKLGLERVVKQLVKRQRPGTSIGHIHARGNVPAHGQSFVSGHSVITTAMAGILTPILPGRWKVVPWVVVALNSMARVYVGAHNPLDVLGGFGLGLFIAGVIDAALLPRRVTKSP
jgi:undecaprenyl-diphosphatase